MKKLTYLSGYLFTLTWIAGALFKMLHLPNASIMLTIGGIGLTCIFLPLFISYRYKSIVKQVLSERLKWSLGSISILLLGIAISMELRHTDGAGLLMSVSFLFIGFGFLPYFFFSMYKKSID